MAHMVGRIRGEPFLEKVIRLLEMEKDPAVRDLAEQRLESTPGLTVEEMTIRILVEQLQARIRFASLGSGVFQVSVADHSPVTAQTLARWIGELFVDTSAQMSLDYLRATHDFGMEQRRVYEEQLRISEQALAQYKASTIEETLSGSLVGPENVILAEALLEQVSGEETMSRVRLKSIVSEVGEGANKPVIADLLGNVHVRSAIPALTSILRDELARRLASGTAGEWPPQGHYNLKRRELLQEVEAQVLDAFVDVPPESRATLVQWAFASVDLEVHAGVAEYLRQEIRKFKRRAESAPGGELELARLEEEVETNRRLLQSFQAQLVASDVSQAMETTKLGLQMEILDPAQIPLAPSRPNRSQILLAALLLGPVVGAGWAFLSESHDGTLRTLDDFARFATEPILGTAPLLSRRIPNPSRTKKYWVPAAVAMVLLLTAVLYVSSDALNARLSTAQPLHVVDPE